MISKLVKALEGALGFFAPGLRPMIPGPYFGASYRQTAAIQASASLGIVGSASYDALLAKCAIKAEAEAIYTCHMRDDLCGSELMGVAETRLCDGFCGNLCIEPLLFVTFSRWKEQLT